MQIYCPKCGIGYNVDDEIVREGLRMVRCSNCGEVFKPEQADVQNSEIDSKEAFENVSKAMSEDVENNAISLEEDAEDSADVGDAENKEDVVADDITLEDIFVRLSEHTESLMEREKKLPFYEKMWLQVKNVLGFHFKIKWSYIFVALFIFVMMSLYNNRYDVVRKVPFMNDVYRMFGIRAKIAGEGLEFQNITWDFVDDEKGVRLEVKGFIYNKTDKVLDVPQLHVEILDKDTQLLQSHNRELKEKEIEAKAKLAINLVLGNPAPTSKYVYLTFVDRD